MSDESFTIGLGGETWTLPRLPWRVAKVIEPALFAVYRSLEPPKPEQPADASANAPVEAAMSFKVSAGAVMALSEDKLDLLAHAVWTATTVATTGPKLTEAEFGDLAFDMRELVAAMAPLALALGKNAGRKAGAELSAAEAARGGGKGKTSR